MKQKYDREFYDTLYRYYTTQFTHTDLENGQYVTYRPMAVCSHIEIDQLLETLGDNPTTKQIMEAMRARVGMPGLRG